MEGALLVAVVGHHAVGTPQHQHLSDLLVALLNRSNRNDQHQHLSDLLVALLNRSNSNDHHQHLSDLLVSLLIEVSYSTYQHLSDLLVTILIEEIVIDRVE